MIFMAFLRKGMVHDLVVVVGNCSYLFIDHFDPCVFTLSGSLSWENQKPKKCHAFCFFSLWVLMLFFMTGMPTLDFHTLDFNCNIIPFRGLIDAPIQYGFNVLIFLPIGCFPSLLWAPFFKWKNILWLGFGLSAFDRNGAVVYFSDDRY